MLDSPFVVKLFGVCINPPMMVMEFVPNGDLFACLHAKAQPFGYNLNFCHMLT